MTIERIPTEKKIDTTKPQRSPEELRKALHVCEVQKKQVQAVKKSVTGSYNDQLKDIESEITAILEQLEAAGEKTA